MHASERPLACSMVAADGDQVKPAEMMPMCVLLLVAGFETTVNLIGKCVLAAASSGRTCAPTAGLSQR